VLTTLEHLVTYDLLYGGDCKLLGVTHDGHIYIEELYGDDDWLAQHDVSIDGGIVHSVDEAQGNNLHITLLELPDGIIKPNPKSCCDYLEFSGSRLRGMLADERIEEVVYPLTVEDKIALVEFMEWDIAPPQIIGIAESTVLSHTQISESIMLVCRRIRIAYRLMQPTVNYDYDSLDVFVLHEHMLDSNAMPELVDCLNDIDDVVLLRPMDCLYHNGYLFVADGGDGEEVSAIHVFEQEKSDNS